MKVISQHIVQHRHHVDVSCNYITSSALRHHTSEVIHSIYSALHIDTNDHYYFLLAAKSAP